VRVDPQDLAEHVAVGEALGIASRYVTGALVVGRSAITDGDVEQAVGAERQVAAVVVELRLVDAHQHATGGGIDLDPVGSPVLDRPLGHHRLPAAGRGARLRREVCGGCRVLGGERVEQSVVPESGVEGKAEEAALVVGEPGDDLGQVAHQQAGQVGDEPPAVVVTVSALVASTVTVSTAPVHGDAPELPVLVRHEQVVPVAGRSGRRDRRLKSPGHRLQRDVDARRRDRRGDRVTQSGCGCREGGDGDERDGCGSGTDVT
jgi:hypothetical protein